MYACEVVPAVELKFFTLSPWQFSFAADASLKGLLAMCTSMQISFAAQSETHSYVTM
jgi:hypothetical protein